MTFDERAVWWLCQHHDISMEASVATAPAVARHFVHLKRGGNLLKYLAAPLKLSTMSSFTPDEQLDLLFAPELISREVKAQLGADLHVYIFVTHINFIKK